MHLSPTTTWLALGVGLAILATFWVVGCWVFDQFAVAREAAAAEESRRKALQRNINELVIACIRYDDEPMLREALLSSIDAYRGRA